MFRNFLFFAAVFLFLANSRAYAAADAGDGAIGTILEVEGSATVTTTKGTVAAAIKTPIHMHDVISTGPQSRVFILFIDDTKFTLSASTKLTVDQYVFDPDNAKNNKGVYDVLEGTFKYTSGLLTKTAKPDVTIKTNYGEIGVRGTVLWGGRLKDSYGVHVDEGAVQVQNSAGAVYVPSGKGTMVKSAKDKPTSAAVFPKEMLDFMQSGVLLQISDAMLGQRISGFAPLNMMMRGKFKNFQQLNGLLPNLPGGGAIPGMPGGLNIPNMPDNGGGSGKKHKKSSGGGIPDFGNLGGSLPSFGR